MEIQNLGGGTISIIHMQSHRYREDNIYLSDATKLANSVTNKETQLGR